MNDQAGGGQVGATTDSLTPDKTLSKVTVLRTLETENARRTPIPHSPQVCLPVCLSVGVSVCLTVCLYVCLSAWLACCVCITPAAQHAR